MSSFQGQHDGDLGLSSIGAKPLSKYAGARHDCELLLRSPITSRRTLRHLSLLHLHTIFAPVDIFLSCSQISWRLNAAEKGSRG